MGERAELLRAALEEEILSGKLSPGERLEEVALAQRMGVSRTPIREALHLLAASGLVEHRPRRGAVVARASPRQLVEMFDVMAELEAMCARLAAKRMTEADLNRMKRAHDDCIEAAGSGELDRYYLDNERFHEAIRTASHNSFLADQTLMLHKRLRPYRRYQLRVENRIKTSLDEHTGILKALEAGDQEAAAAAMRSHISVQGERFTDLIASFKTSIAKAG